MRPSFRKSDESSRWRNRMLFLVSSLSMFALTFHWILVVEDSNCLQQQKLHVEEASYSNNQDDSRIPKNHRLVTASSCPANRSHNFAPASPLPKLDLKIQREYAAGGYNQIAKGSGEVNAVGPVLNLISKRQHENGIYGTLAEMGVHHGRFTGFLFITARQTEQLVVADLFEKQQDKNVDKSGLGDRRSFLKGLSTYGLSEGDMHTIFTGSTDEIPFDWSQTAGFHPFRLISVDAGHTAELTFNDLEITFCNLLKGGVVILDDWFSSNWPGVVEGYFQFVSMGPTPEIYPILVCESKLFVTNDKEYHQLYYQSLLDDQELSQLITPFAHEKERGKLLYEMNGVNYLKCQSRGSMNLTVANIQNLWVERVY